MQAERACQLSENPGLLRAFSIWTERSSRRVKNTAIDAKNRRLCYAWIKMDNVCVMKKSCSFLTKHEAILFVVVDGSQLSAFVHAVPVVLGERAEIVRLAVGSSKNLNIRQ